MAHHPYDQSKPCDSCPFLKGEKAVRVTRPRAEGLVNQDETFYCHKTTGGTESKISSTSKACAGWLIFMNKIGKPNQIMRIAERMGIYDPRELMSEEDQTKRVCDTLAELLELHGA